MADVTAAMPVSAAEGVVYLPASVCCLFHRVLPSPGYVHTAAGGSVRWRVGGSGWDALC